MFKKILLIASPVLLLIVLASGTQSDNGIAGKVGSPGENRCTECHNSFAINSGSGSIELRTGMTNNEYVPGQTYTMVFKVAFPGRSLFGMGLESLTSTNTNAGTFTMTTNKTTTKNATIGTTSRRSVVHTLNGGASADSMLFTFNWTAPVSGTVTFYYCGVASNASASTIGDYVYSGSMVVNPVGTAGIEDPVAISNLTISPNPASDHIVVNFTPNSHGAAAVNLYDLSGKSVRAENIGLVPGNNSEIRWNGIDELPKGVYLLSVSIGESLQTKRVVIQ
ncbi:MAG: choice-of-anchor V domain-containing protein [Bacteroidota bacterium]